MRPYYEETSYLSCSSLLQRMVASDMTPLPSSKQELRTRRMFTSRPLLPFFFSLSFRSFLAGQRISSGGFACSAIISVIAHIVLLALVATQWPSLCILSCLMVDLSPMSYGATTTGWRNLAGMAMTTQDQQQNFHKHIWSVWWWKCQRLRSTKRMRVQHANVIGGISHRSTPALAWCMWKWKWQF